jgi:hypothetical protein
VHAHHTSCAAPPALPLPQRSIWALVKDEPSTSVLVAAHGRGAAVLQRQRIFHGAAGAPLRLGGPCALSVPDASDEQVGVALRAALARAPGVAVGACSQGPSARPGLAMPRNRQQALDSRALSPQGWEEAPAPPPPFCQAPSRSHRTLPAPAPAPAPAPQHVVIPFDLWQEPCSIRSLIQVPIGAPDNPCGVLLLGAAAPRTFEGKDWQVQLRVTAAGLLPHVRHAQVQQMAHLLKALDEAQDPVELISELLRVGALEPTSKTGLFMAAAMSLCVFCLWTAVFARLFAPAPAAPWFLLSAPPSPSAPARAERRPLHGQGLQHARQRAAGNGRPLRARPRAAL